MFNTKATPETGEAPAAEGTGSFPVMAAPAPTAVIREAEAIRRDWARQSRSKHNVEEINQKILELMEVLGQEERIVSELGESLPYRAEALELLCKKRGWTVPDMTPPQFTPQPPSWPAPENGALGSLAPNTCPERGCGREMQHVDGTWLHTANNSKDCPGGAA